jgi:hypothetical protein
VTHRTNPIENCKLDVGTSKDSAGKVWVRLIFHESDGEERAYAYDVAAATWLVGALETAVRIAESSNPSN